MSYQEQSQFAAILIQIDMNDDSNCLFTNLLQGSFVIKNDLTNSDLFHILIGRGERGEFPSNRFFLKYLLKKPIEILL